VWLGAHAGLLLAPYNAELHSVAPQVLEDCIKLVAQLLGFIGF
jgi:hypothetical protein